MGFIFTFIISNKLDTPVLIITTYNVSKLQGRKLKAFCILSADSKKITKAKKRCNYFMKNIIWKFTYMKKRQLDFSLCYSFYLHSIFLTGNFQNISFVVISIEKVITSSVICTCLLSILKKNPEDVVMQTNGLTDGHKIQNKCAGEQ